MSRFAAICLSALAFALLPTRAAHAQGAVPAGSDKVAIPTTVAGQAISQWLEAFNDADSVKLAAYYRRYRLDRSLSAQLVRRQLSGGFDVVSIERNEPRLLELVLKQRATGNLNYVIAEVAPGDTSLKQAWNVDIPRGRTAAVFKIDAATRGKVIEAAIAQLDIHYVFPDVATKMAATVRSNLKRGDYDNVTNGLTFAGRLTDDFRSVSHDRHLGVNFIAGGIPDRRDGPPDSAAVRQMRQQMQSMNCGFVKTEVLPGNVGYLKFNFFAETDVCGPIASTAMNTLADADALIVDLRENGGGQPAMVAYVSSYLFAERTHLNDIWTRRTNSTEEYWTRDVPGKKFGGTKPVYVLTSHNTFSGAEEFTYNLKNLKRATIIGETTGGGAHPVYSHRIDERFMIGVPFARAINPISKTNWEGTGVEPDVKVPAAEALATAQRMIAERGKP